MTSHQPTGSRLPPCRRRVPAGAGGGHARPGHAPLLPLRQLEPTETTSCSSATPSPARPAWPTGGRSSSGPMPDAHRPRRDCVLGVNVLGSCYGSTGPTSHRPRDGQALRPRLPPRQHPRHRSAPRRCSSTTSASHASRSPSAAPSAACRPSRGPSSSPSASPRRLASASPLSALGLGLNHLQRQAIRSTPPGTAAATPPTPATHSRPRPRPRPRPCLLLQVRPSCSTSASPASPTAAARDPTGHRAAASTWPATSTTRAAASTAASTPTATSPSAAPWTPSTPPAATPPPTPPTPHRGRTHPHRHLLRLALPPEDIRALAQTMQSAGANCTYRELLSTHGHDAFLAEPDLLIAAFNNLIASNLATLVQSRHPQSCFPISHLCPRMGHDRAIPPAVFAILHRRANHRAGR